MGFYMANMLDIFCCRLVTKRKLKSIVDKMYVTWFGIWDCCVYDLSFPRG